MSEYHAHSKYAFIVMACKKYIPEVNGLLNSLDFVGNKNDVYLYMYDFPEDYIRKIAETKWTYHLHLRIISEEEARSYGGESEIVCRKRYWYAAEIGEHYDAVCVLDADLIFTRDPVQFFDISAKTGFVVGPSKEQNKVYDDPHHTVGGEYIIPKGYYNRVDLCNCPVFVDADIWGDAFRKSWEIFTRDFPNTNFKAPDMDAMNVCLIEAGSADKTILLPNQCWLGTNEKMLKPYMRAISDRGLPKNECGEPIFCFHGQYYKKPWRDCQLGNRHHCASGYLKATECSDNMARGAMDLLYSIFCKMCFEHKVTIEKKNYVHPEKGYEE